MHNNKPGDLQRLRRHLCSSLFSLSRPPARYFYDITRPPPRTTVAARTLPAGWVAWPLHIHLAEIQTTCWRVMLFLMKSARFIVALQKNNVTFFHQLNSINLLSNTITSSRVTFTINKTLPYKVHDCWICVPRRKHYNIDSLRLPKRQTSTYEAKDEREKVGKSG